MRRLYLLLILEIALSKRDAVIYGIDASLQGTCFENV